MSEDVSAKIHRAKHFVELGLQLGTVGGVLAAVAATIEALECLAPPAPTPATPEDLAWVDAHSTEYVSPDPGPGPTMSEQTLEMALAIERKAFLAERADSKQLREDLTVARESREEQRRRAESAEQTIVELYDKEKAQRVRADAAEATAQRHLDLAKNLAQKRDTAESDIKALMPLGIAAQDILTASPISFDRSLGASIGYWFADHTLPTTEVRFNPRVRLTVEALRAAADVHKRRT